MIYINGEAQESGGTLAEDALDGNWTTLTADADGGSGGYNHIDILSEAELELATKTVVFAADSMAVAVGTAMLHASDLNQLIIRLYIDGTVVASEYVTNAVTTMHILEGTKAVSGSTVCKLTVYNEDSSTHTITAYTEASTTKLPFAIGVGSVKLT